MIEIRSFNPYSSAHAILVLTALRPRFQALIAESVAEEFARWPDAKVAELPADQAARLRAGVDGWLLRARPARMPWPSAAELAAPADLLAAVRHANDLPSVVAALLAQPDWVLSTNTKPRARRPRRLAHSPSRGLSRAPPPLMIGLSAAW
ncbi:MAG: hypothetical protein ACRDGS_12860 [Chloroflexota bacterium]